MIITYFDCFSGIAGDMILGALVDLGVDSDFLKNELKKLDVYGYEINFKKVEKNHITGTDVFVNVKEKQKHRNLSDINDIIDKSGLDNDVKNLSEKIFYRLAEAESKIHNKKINDIHFHEVGAVDSIIDIIGSVIGMKKLGLKKIFCSKLPLGKGFVNCSHGVIPIPAPATVELLKGIPVYQTDADHEMVTPTGAAFITTVSSGFGEMPLMKIIKIGYGAGKIESSQPNLLRIILGESE